VRIPTTLFAVKVLHPPMKVGMLSPIMEFGSVVTVDLEIDR
jgi:hypothetical protein